MKNNLVCLLCLIILLTSCSTAYKTSQTPDDVYYSPAQKLIPANEYDTYASSDDEYLHMKVKDHDKWSSLDDYDYWYDSRYYMNNYYSPWTSSFSLSIGFGAYYPYYSYNPYWYNPWQSWYCPYYTVVYYKNPTVYYKPVTRYNTLGYSNHNYNTYNMPMQSGSRSNIYNNTNNFNNTNSSLNRTRTSNFNTSNNSNPTRTFNSGSMSSGGSRMSGGGGGGTRTRP